MKKAALLISIILTTCIIHAQEIIRGRSNAGYVNITAEPPKPPFLELVNGSLEFRDVNNNQMIDANENTNISFFIKNSGTGPGNNMTANIVSEGMVQGLEYIERFDIGTLRPDHVLKVNIPIRADMQTKDGNVRFRIVVHESNGFGMDPVIIEIPTRAFVEPKVKVVDYVITGNESAAVKKKRPFNVEVLVQNVGKRKAEHVEISLSIPDNMYCLSSNEHYFIGDIAPGESKLVNYNFVTTNNYNLDEIRIHAEINEKYGKYGENSDLVMAMNQEVTTRQIKLSGKEEKIKIIEASLLSEVDKNIPYMPVKKPGRVALIIGNENYAGILSDEVNVPFAINDAKIFKHYAVNVLGVDEERNLFYLTDATAGEMRREIDRVSRLLYKMGQSSELIFYYAGHGYPDEENNTPYMIPVDVDASNLKSAIRLSEVYEKFGNSGAKRVTVFLDACFSGGGRNQGILASRGIRIKPGGVNISGNMVVFSASKGNQVSLPYEKEKHGLFTYYLLKKLQETKGDVYYEELANYLKKEVGTESIRLKGKEQDPEIKASPAVVNNWKYWKLTE